jgi:hypothetical protein
MNRIAKLTTVVAFLGFIISDLPALTESEFRGKYPLAAEHHPGTFKEHPAGRYRVYTQCGVRECDIDGGDVTVLAFYDGKTLIRTYSLKQIISDQKTWDFHPASGVFIWLVFNPRLNGFHEYTYTVMTSSGIRTFAIATGELIEPQAAEQNAAGQPAKRPESK